MFNLDIGINISGYLSVVGNPDEILQGRLKCFDFIFDLAEGKTSFKYYIQISSLFMTLGVLVVILIFELILCIYKKY